ncbi:MAG: HEPN domain-containing protein [Bacteroidales bacterium]|nr:HEPN domain-containing protein [Bacteroidales bacterium]
MSLTPEERMAILDLKIEKANKAYDDMLANFKEERYSTAANRLYYSLFYACSALLVKNGYEAHSHAGNMTLINQHFVKTGVIPIGFKNLLRDALSLRKSSDYDDYFSIEKADLEQMVEPARQFIDLVDSLT